VSVDAEHPDLFKIRINCRDPPQTFTVSAIKSCIAIGFLGLVKNLSRLKMKYKRIFLTCSVVLLISLLWTGLVISVKKISNKGFVLSNSFSMLNKLQLVDVPQNAIKYMLSEQNAWSSQRKHRNSDVHHLRKAVKRHEQSTI